MSAKPKPTAELDAKAVYQVIQDLRKDVEKLQDENELQTRAMRVLSKQNRELLARFDVMEATQASDRSTWSNQHAQLVTEIREVVGANIKLSIENDALFRALGMRALKAMTAPIQIDKATIMRLIQTVQAQELAGAPFNADDLARSLRERDQPLHRNSGN